VSGVEAILTMQEYFIRSTTNLRGRGDEYSKDIAEEADDTTADEQYEVVTAIYNTESSGQDTRMNRNSISDTVRLVSTKIGQRRVRFRYMAPDEQQSTQHIMNTQEIISFHLANLTDTRGSRGRRRTLPIGYSAPVITN
jgi:hypothetical protein